MGVHNKKALEKKLYDLQEKEDTFNLGIMMFDLNNLKKINDTYGHELPQSLLSDSGFDENSWRKNVWGQALQKRTYELCSSIDKL